MVIYGVLPRKLTGSLWHNWIPANIAQDYLKRRDGKHLDLVDILGIGLAVAKGIEFLHTQKPPIMHRDIKVL